MMATILAIIILNSNGSVEYQSPPINHETYFPLHRESSYSLQSDMQSQIDRVQRDSDRFHDRVIEQQVLSELNALNRNRR